MCETCWRACSLLLTPHSTFLQPQSVAEQSQTVWDAFLDVDVQPRATASLHKSSVSSSSAAAGCCFKRSSSQAPQAPQSLRPPPSTKFHEEAWSSLAGAAALQQHQAGQQLKGWQQQQRQQQQQQQYDDRQLCTQGQHPRQGQLNHGQQLHDEPCQQQRHFQPYPSGEHSLPSTRAMMLPDRLLSCGPPASIPIWDLTDEPALYDHEGITQVYHVVHLGKVVGQQGEVREAAGGPGGCRADLRAHRTLPVPHLDEGRLPSRMPSSSSRGMAWAALPQAADSTQRQPQVTGAPHSMRGVSCHSDSPAPPGQLLQPSGSCGHHRQPQASVPHVVSSGGVSPPNAWHEHRQPQTSVPHVVGSGGVSPPNAWHEHRQPQTSVPHVVGSGDGGSPPSAWHEFTSPAAGGGWGGAGLQAAGGAWGGGSRQQQQQNAGALRPGAGPGLWQPRPHADASAAGGPLMRVQVGLQLCPDRVCPAALPCRAHQSRPSGACRVSGRVGKGPARDFLKPYKPYKP